MAKPTANLRLFVAAYPPAESARAMLSALEPLALPPHRVTLLEQLHLTLQFIGDTPQTQMDATIESVQRAAAGLKAFQLTPRRLITLPERGPTRLVAVETDAPATLLELQRRLAMRLARNVREKPGDRYRPHLTLCRFRSPTRGVKIDQEFALEPFPIDRIRLMCSTLSSNGAQHVEVMAWEL